MTAILALDIGSRTGWAVRTPEGFRVSGFEDFKTLRGEGAGMRLLRFKRFLTETKVGGLDMLVYEQIDFSSTTYAAQLYGQFCGIVFAWCEHHCIPYTGVPLSAIKRHGTGKGGGKGANKLAMIAAAARLGVATEDDNEADAVVLLDYAERHLTEYEPDQSNSKRRGVDDAARPGRA
jgi:Holliday junction resolvasome RuvABC endonuclease subunit